ncbi:chromatin remodeling complex subunit, Chd3 [Rhodotorula toruloides]|uniref:Chromatin remodeling complex subunit, Chd3 n=1 Tax=Rhodotorula toruloides TaxID=5286 RepID=A0A511KFQ8_RHOTO|nr:chromatin remodeling complex subunit, Chd3 [Rhodotorula toruloides]
MGDSDGKAVREGSGVEVKQDAPKVARILSVQQTEGVGKTYLCVLDGSGKKVQRTRSQLRDLAADLLSAFDSSQKPTSAATSRSTSSSSNAAVAAVLRGGRGAPRVAQASTKGKGKGKERAADDDDEEMQYAMEDAGESSDEPDNNSVDETMDEPSSTSASENDDSDDDISDDELAIGSRRQRLRKRKEKAVKPTRRSERGEGRKAKRYDFGEGHDAGDDSDVNFVSATTSSSDLARKTRASKARKTRSSPEEDDSRLGESSDELSMTARPRRVQPQPRRSPAQRSNVPLRKVQAAVEDSEEEGQEVDELASDSVEGDALETCAKCGQASASELFRFLNDRKRRKKPGRKRKRDILEEDTDAEEERLEKLGAWVDCGVCCVAYHFGCLPASQKREITDQLKDEHLALYETPGAADKSTALSVPAGTKSAGLSLTSLIASTTASAATSKSGSPRLNIPKREKYELDPERVFTMRKCPSCKKMGGRRCFVCGVSGKVVTKREREELIKKGDMLEDTTEQTAKSGMDDAEQSGDADETMKDQTADAPKKSEDADIVPGQMFRCSRCKRVAHYGCLENDEPDWTFEQHCQSYFDWQICHDCYNFNVPLDVILAWRETQPVAEVGPDDIESDDEVLDRIEGEKLVDEDTKKVVYLVKWQEMSYRHLVWVPHAFLAAAYPSKLANFLARGSTVTFEPANDDDPDDSDPTDVKAENEEAPLPDPNALDRIPKTWRTVDRILDVWYDHPKKEGEHVGFTEYRKKLPQDADESVKLVSQCYIKWGELPYAQSTIEAPLKEDEEGHDAFVKAYKAFLAASEPSMSVPKLSQLQMDELDRPRDPKHFKPLESQPEYITGGKLMDFQIAGVNFLRYQWWQRKGCILADEMGLGKTCQIISFLSYLNCDEGARPFLVVVPNSLIGNWMREFEKWAPTMRVVPYNGDGESRKIIEDYELFDSSGSLKTHVVLATYEAVQGNARVFRRVDRWDCLVVDEGQRLKSGKDSQLYNAITSLRIAQRVILSGTPLNNNLRELFNLLAFINPTEFTDIEALTRRFAELTPELVEDIREMLKPYFLRRTKDLVLNLPPLLEVVVPVSMTVLQRQIYRGILERNAGAIRSIVQKSGTSTHGRAKPKKSNFSNILMELRKALCHPYLVDDDIEPRNVTPQQSQVNLTEASAKFVLLARMLPKLKAAGHRVLIFSQFKLTLNIIERFLAGLELRYLRLDGDTPQLERQRDVDKFNAPGSEYFAYLLSTRAGGVGLNITSADVVIIYDQDFNPQMDIQAISRAHRIGQTKPVRVFKLLVKGTCEEKILNAGNKKRGLEHLIIQRINAQDESEDMESMLQFGAKAVFNEAAAEAAAIRYNDSDVDALLAKTAEPVENESDSSATFSHAQIWVREHGELDAAPQEATDTAAESTEDLHDFWSKVVEQQQEAEKATKAGQVSTVGRGKRRRAQVDYKIGGEASESPPKKTKHVDSKSPSAHDHSSGDEYRLRLDELDSDDEAPVAMDVDEGLYDVEGTAKPPPLAHLDPGKTPGATSSDASKSKARKSVVTDPAEVAALRAKKAKRRTAAIDALLRAAGDLNDKTSLDLLSGARSSNSRKEQTNAAIVNQLPPMASSGLQATNTLSDSQAQPASFVDRAFARAGKVPIKAPQVAAGPESSEADTERRAKEGKEVKRLRKESRARELETGRPTGVARPGDDQLMGKADATARPPAAAATYPLANSGTSTSRPAGAAPTRAGAGLSHPLSKRPTPPSALDPRLPTLALPSASKSFSLPPQASASASTDAESKSPPDHVAPAMAQAKSGDKSDSSKSSASSSSKYKQSRLSFGPPAPDTSTSQPLNTVDPVKASSSEPFETEFRLSTAATSAAAGPQPKAPSAAAKPCPAAPHPALVAKKTEILVISDSEDDT